MDPPRTTTLERLSQVKLGFNGRSLTRCGGARKRTGDADANAASGFEPKVQREKRRSALSIRLVQKPRKAS